MLRKFSGEEWFNVVSEGMTEEQEILKNLFIRRALAHIDDSDRGTLQDVRAAYADYMGAGGSSHDLDSHILDFVNRGMLSNEESDFIRTGKRTEDTGGPEIG